MITLGGVTISNNMYLDGLIQANPIVSEQERTIEGVPILTVRSNVGGRQLTLGTSQLGNSIQGIWCQSVVDELKAVQETGAALTLDYHGDIYTVVITSTSDIKQLFQFEPVSPDKKYIGVISLTEV